MWTQVRAIAAVEWRMQRREPATVLYALVFLLLTFGFVSSGTVELVRTREALPKLSPLAITLALGGLTAFGQVITTMVTASAFLRDAAWRTDQLLFTTSLDRRAWVLGRWLASLAVLALVSLAMPLGVLLGAAAPWVRHDGSWWSLVGRALWPWWSLTLPTVVVVGTLLSVAAVRTRRLLGVLAAALALLFVWQGAEALRRATQEGRAPKGWASVAALGDPFGTVSVQQQTASWDATTRARATVPFSGQIAGSRVLWLTLSLLLGAITLTRTVPTTASPRRERIGSAAHHAEGSTASIAHAPAITTLSRGFCLWRMPQLLALARVTLTWTWRETGWRIIGALGALNVAANVVVSSTGAGDGGGDAALLLLLVREHARLFLILLATIYAGELLWRDHDDRVQALVASAPIATPILVGARVLGLTVAQALLVALLTGAALLGALVAGRVDVPNIAMTIDVLGGVVLWLWLPFVHWLLLSLLVHVMVRHKVIAHLLLIAGWVAAVALDANGAHLWWVRFADPPPLASGVALPWSDAVVRSVWWSGVSAGCLWLTIRRWPRVTSPR